MIKTIIFCKDIIEPLDYEEKENEEINRKIKESKEAYRFFMELISNGKCNIKKYAKVLHKLNKSNITQKDMDEDDTRSLREGFAKMINDRILLPFINEYKNYLK